MMRSFLLLLACLTLVMLAGEADAINEEPLWKYTAEPDSPIYSVIMSANGDYIVGYTEDKMYLFDSYSSTPLWNYTGTFATWHSTAISADGEYIVAGFNDNNVYLFDKDSSTPLWNYTTESYMRFVAISADGEYIVTSNSSTVYLFEKESSTPLWHFTTDGGIRSLAISANGEYITSSGKCNVYLFEKDSSTPLWSYDFGVDQENCTYPSVTTVDISADGEYIVAGTQDDGGKVYLFDKDSSTPLWSYEVGDNMYSVAISADGEYIVAGSYDDNVYLFDKDSSTPLWSYTTGSIVWLVAISADGEYIVASNLSTVYLFEKESSTPLWHFTPGDNSAQSETVTSVAISADGEQVAVGNRIYDGNSHSGNLYLFGNIPPTATIDSVYPSPAGKGTTVFFNGTGSDSDGTVVAYQWKSSIDGELSTEEDFSSSNLSSGHHTITFQVQDSSGKWSSPHSESLWSYAVPVAIAGQDSTGTPGVPLQFSGAGTDEDGTVVLYEWDFDGDGIFEWSSTENGRELNIYNNEGTYTATLRVTDNDGFTGTDTVKITISEKKVQIDDDGNVIVTDAEEDEEGIPTLSVITTMVAVAVMALRRRPE